VGASLAGPKACLLRTTGLEGAPGVSGRAGSPSRAPRGTAAQDGSCGHTGSARAAGTPHAVARRRRADSGKAVVVGAGGRSRSLRLRSSESAPRGTSTDGRTLMLDNQQKGHILSPSKIPARKRRVIRCARNIIR